MRPLRLYQHTFVNGTQRLDLVRTGDTPCAAKRKAFEALEQTLVDQPTLPKTGWRLQQQQDVTHLVTR